MRRKARVSVLKALFSEEFNKDKGDELLERLISSKVFTDNDRDFARRLFYRTKEMKEEIDKTIKENLKNWSLKRLSKVDLNILRIAIAEIEEFAETPARVVIDEAVDIAKIYGEGKSGKFVNAVLDKVFKEKGYL